MDILEDEKAYFELFLLGKTKDFLILFGLGNGVPQT
jgi:hypothetical protein